MVILDILNRLDITIYANTSLGKIMPFQAIFPVKIGAIIFVISVMVALIGDPIDLKHIKLKLSHF